jgi:predicted TIM-barrel fold metal-dependent hydrolase
VTKIAAIDVHAHYGDYLRGEDELVDHWLSCSAIGVVERARQQAHVELTIASPLAGLMPRGGSDPVTANEEAAATVASIEGLLQWVIVHPDVPKTFEQAERMLGQEQCVGIKLHPEEHQYPIREHGAAMFELAARHDAVVLVHSGDPFSLPVDFLPWADEFSNITLLLAHLGNGGGAAGDPTLQVRAIQASQHGNVLVDTSSARSILPGLVEWAVAEVGAEKILFGTDTPLYSVAMQRARIDQAQISESEKRAILYINAQRVLDLPTLKTGEKP